MRTRSQIIEQYQLLNSPALSFKRMMKSDHVPGYSMDFQRAFGRYFFHGARHYARTKYGHTLRSYIADARMLHNNNATKIGDYMEDHLEKTILDPRGDWGIWRAGVFLWTLGYVPQAAMMNLTQTPVVTFTHLAGKFGGVGVGNVRAAKALIKHSTNVKNFYRRGTIEQMSGFEWEAL